MEQARRESGVRAEAPKGVNRPRREGGSNSVVESQPSKLLVAGSIPVSRSSLRPSELATEMRRERRRATAGKPNVRRRLSAEAACGRGEGGPMAEG